MITIIYQFKHNVTWHCRINQFFSFPEQLQSWIYVFLVGDHRNNNKHFHHCTQLGNFARPNYVMKYSNRDLLAKETKNQYSIRGY